MAFYYDSEDEVKGQLLDELAKDLIADWHVDKLDLYGQDERKIPGKNMAGDVQERIANYFPSIERLLPVKTEELLGESPKSRERREEFKWAAGQMYKFLNRLFIPPSLLKAIADTPQVEMKSKRFKHIFQDINMTATNTGLNKRKLWSPLEQLVRETNDFQAMELVVSKFNAFFGAADLIPQYTQSVAELVDTGWDVNLVADIVRESFHMSSNPKYTGVVRSLMETLEQDDASILMKELRMLPESELQLGEEESQEKSRVGEVSIKDHGRRKLTLENFETYADRVGLFLGLAGRIAFDYEFNNTASEIELTAGLAKKVTEGTCLVYNDGENRISLTLGNDGTLEFEGVAVEQLQEFIFDLQEAGNYVTGLYAAMEMLSMLEDSRKHIDSSLPATGRSSVRHMAGAVECLASGIDIQQRTIKEVYLSVKSTERIRLYEELLLLTDQTDFEYIASKGEENVELWMKLGDVPEAAAKESLQDILASIDTYTTHGTEGSKSSLLDFVCYLNENAQRKYLPHILDQGPEILGRVGTLFVYPQAFERGFERLNDTEQEIAVKILYSLESIPANLKDAQQWLSEEYRELIVDKGLETV